MAESLVSTGNQAGLFEGPLQIVGRKLVYPRALAASGQEAELPKNPFQLLDRGLIQPGVCECLESLAVSVQEVWTRVPGSWWMAQTRVPGTYYGEAGLAKIPWQLWDRRLGWQRVSGSCCTGVSLARRPWQLVDKVLLQTRVPGSYGTGTALEKSHWQLVDRNFSQVFLVATGEEADFLESPWSIVNRKTGLAKVPCSHWIGACLDKSSWLLVDTRLSANSPCWLRQARVLGS